MGVGWKPQGVDGVAAAGTDDIDDCCVDGVLLTVAELLVEVD